MPRYRDDLPQLAADRLFLTDGGIETTLIFDDGFDLPDFAAFLLLETEEGRRALARYFDAYTAIAVRDRVGIVLETPTWRASADWGARLGYSSEQLDDLNRRAVALTLASRRAETPDTPVVVSGCIGPRGDGYQPGELMSPDEARAYHALQVRTFAATDADLVTAITMTNSAEAIGIARAAQAAGIPAVISFTVETDGRLPTGQRLEDAIAEVDAATDAYPAYYMVNCAHPSHVEADAGNGADDANGGTPWPARLRGLRANASRLSHAELDEAEELDRGDAAELARDYVRLRAAHPPLTVLGGCCGTSHEHVGAISAACARQPAG